MTHHHSPAPWGAHVAGDFQSQMAIAVRFKQKKSNVAKTGMGRGASLLCVCVFFFHHVNSGRRASPTGDSDLFAMQTFFVFFQSAKKHVKGAKAKATTNVADIGNCQARYTLCL